MSLLTVMGQAATRAVAHGLENTDRPLAKAGLSALSTGVKAVAQAGDAMDRYFTSGAALMEKMGLGDLVGKMKVTDQTAYLRAGTSVQKMHEILAPFEKKNWRGAMKHDMNDLSNIVDVIEMADKPKSQAHAEAAERLRELMDEYGDDAVTLKMPVFSAGRYHTLRDAYLKQGLDQREAERLAKVGSSKKFVKRENYFPHYFDELTIAKYLAGGKTTDDAVERILAQGLADNRDEAVILLKRMLRAPAEFRGGPLAYVRDGHDFLTDYDKDPLNVLTRYFLTSARRLESARTFGTDDKIALEAIGKVGSATHQKNAHSLYRAWVGDVDPSYKDLARMASTFHAVTMLSTSGIVQPAQLMNTVARVGWTNTLKAMGTVAKDWRKAKLFAGSTGAIFDNIHKDFTPDSFGGLSDMWVRTIGLEQLDKANRVVSAVAGKFWAQEVATKLAKNEIEGPRLKTIVDSFHAMGVDLKDLMVRGGVLNDEEIRKAGLYMSQNTQFASGVLDLPEMRNQPIGRFLYLFKSFAFQQTRFIKDELVKPASRGDYRPLLHWTMAASIAAPVVGELVRKLKNRDTPEDVKLHIIENFAYVGAFGMFYDAFRAMAGGPGSIFNWVLGPSAGEAAQFLGSDVSALVEGPIKGEAPNFEPLTRHFISRVPGAGQWLRGAMDD